MVRPLPSPLCTLLYLLGFLALLSCLTPALAAPADNGGLFPASSSLVDFGFLLDAPAGKRGFLRVDGAGRLAWPDGKRARFWGVNISNRSVFVPRQVIDRVVPALARSGVNMVRFEALDSTGGLLGGPDATSSRAINPARLAVLDYWTSCLRARGIYYYFDLLDFRQFRAGDGVPGADGLGRAARPYAIFDARLRELQDEFARQLLTHRNPYTHLRYVDDPALAVVEVCNEHGLMIGADGLDGLEAPYGATLRQRWNLWLTGRYGSRNLLRAAWGAQEGVPVLGQDEDPAQYTVYLPSFRSDEASGGASVASRCALARVRDGVRFLADLQRCYFAERRAALRAMGLHVPITASVSTEILPDTASVAAELDLTAGNYYASHPAFAEGPWKGDLYYNDANPLRASSVFQVAPLMAGLRWSGKPVAIREWAVVWPCRYRVVGIPDVLAYARLQDVDIVLLFGYHTDVHPDALGDFDHQADSTVWGQFAMAALAFQRGDVRSASHTVAVAHTEQRLTTWPNVVAGPHRMAWISRVENVLPGMKRARRSVTVSVPSTSSSVAAAALLAAAGVRDSASGMKTGVIRSDTGEIVRNTRRGVLTVASPRYVSVAGELAAAGNVYAGKWCVSTATPVGALTALSLDGKPLSVSRRYLIKMVSVAENAGQQTVAAPAGSPGPRKLVSWGTAPVKTCGMPGKVTRVVVAGRTLLTIGLVNGSWELLIDGGKATIVSDTDGISATVLGHGLRLSAGISATVQVVAPAERVGR